MNLQALYDLKERLQYAAIAGTGLIQEDFRLRRAVDALAPLAAASPVFAKISTAAKALLAAPQAERSTRLLDVLSLVDAVVYTQGVTNIPGDLEPVRSGSGAYVHAAYSQLSPLIDALSGTGSGRTALIRENWLNHPEYFSDFRVLPHVVRALGDTYSELAGMIATILEAQGSSIIPLLKENFDPAGKMEMARRVRLVAKLAGEKENDWFVSILPESKKDVREAVIQTLSLCQENARLLLDLCQSERGKLKEAAMRSLAMMQTDACVEFWKQEARKRPASVACLAGVDSPLAADLAAAALRGDLEKMLAKGQIYDSAGLDTLSKLTDAVCGKYSDEIIAFWRWAADKMDDFSLILPDSLIRGSDLSVAEHLQKCMLQTVLWNPCTGVLDLARALSEDNRKWFLCCGFLADLLEYPAQQVYDTYAASIVRTGLLKKENEEQENERIQIMKGFAPLHWDDDRHCYCLVFTGKNALSGTNVETTRDIPGVDPRWVQLLADHNINQECDVFDMRNLQLARKIQTRVEFILMEMINPQDDFVREVCGAYFYKRVMLTGWLQNYLDALLRCGWKNWKGLLAHCAAKENQVVYHRMISVLERLPIANGEKAAELRQLNHLVETGRVSVWNRIWPADSINRMIAQLEAEPSEMTKLGGN